MKFLLIVLMTLCAVPAFAGAEIGQPVPALVAPQLDDKPFDLAKQRGKVVVVSFWATWCIPCHEEMPILDAVYKKYQPRGLVLIGVSVDKARERDRAYAMIHKYSYPSILRSDATVDEFGLPDEVPTAYIIDRSGTVRAMLTDDPPVTEDSLGKVLEPLLTEK